MCRQQRKVRMTSYQTVNLEIEINSEEIAEAMDVYEVTRHIDTCEVAQQVADDISPSDVAEAMDVSAVSNEVLDNMDMDELAESIVRRANPELMASIRKLTEAMQHVAKIVGVR